MKTIEDNSIENRQKLSRKLKEQKRVVKTLYIKLYKKVEIKSSTGDLKIKDDSEKL